MCDSTPERVEASKDKWWACDGQKVVATLADAICGRSSGHNMSKDEVSTKVLTASECTSIVRSTTWTGTFKAIQAGDLAGAQAQLDGTTVEAILLCRGFTYFHKATSLKIPKEENDCKVVYTALFDLNKMVVSKIQSKISNIFVLRKSTTLEFAKRVRESLCMQKCMHGCTDWATSVFPILLFWRASATVEI